MPLMDQIIHNYSLNTTTYLKQGNAVKKYSPDVVQGIAAYDAAAEQLNFS